MDSTLFYAWKAFRYNNNTLGHFYMLAKIMAGIAYHLSALLIANYTLSETMRIQASSQRDKLHT